MLVVFALLPESPRYLGLREPAGRRLAATLGALQLPAAGIVYEADPPARRWRLFELFAPGRAYGTVLLWAIFIGVGCPLSFFTNWLTKISTQSGYNGVDAMNCYSGGAIVGGLLLPLLSRRWHHDSVLLGTLIAAAAATAGIGLALGLSMPVHLVIAFLCGVFVSGAFFLLYPPAVRFYPTDIRSTGVGSAVAFGRFGNMGSPIVAGAMLDAGCTAQDVFWVMAAPLLLSCTALFLFHRHTVPRRRS
jgi:sugar phosphate permease